VCRAPWPQGTKNFDGLLRVRSIQQLCSRFNENSWLGLPLKPKTAWLAEPENNAPHVTLAIQGGLSDSPYWMEKRPGLLTPVLDWRSVE
jgi:hypothetical protein